MLVKRFLFGQAKGTTSIIKKFSNKISADLIISIAQYIIYYFLLFHFVIAPRYKTKEPNLGPFALN